MTERDADCELTKTEAFCGGPFLCPTVLAVNIDRALFEREALKRDSEYAALCGCGDATCEAPGDLVVYCDSVTKLCRTRYRETTPDVPHGDASSALESQDGGVSWADGSARGDAQSDAGDSRFACETAADCEIKNVGNCCGYYPRCANKDATFTPPDCGGLGGVCGFPSIEECACRENVCRSLQNGREI